MQPDSITPPVPASASAVPWRMARRLASRIGFGLVSLFGALTIVFMISRLTGDPATLMSPPGADKGQIDLVRVQYGFDRPLILQYFRFLGGLLRGDLGQSYYYQQDVGSLVGAHILPTVYLAASAVIFALVFGVGFGLLAAFHKDRGIDRVLGSLTMLGQAVPSFWLAPMLILIAAVWLGILPATGMEGARSFVLPTVSLGALQLAVFFRFTRSVAIESLGQDFTRVARSKGIGGWRLAVDHVLPTTALPLLTLGGMALASLIGGAVIVETIFAWPGLGHLMIQAVLQRDFPVVQGVALVFSMAFIVMNTIVDVLYPVLDPRLRVEAER